MTPAERIVMQQALEALEKAADDSDRVEDADFGIRCCCGVRDYKPHATGCELSKSITNLRTALAEPSEPAPSVEPFHADDPKFREAFDATTKDGNWPAARKGDRYRSPMTDMAFLIAYGTVNRLKLYTTPPDAAARISGLEAELKDVQGNHNALKMAIALGTSFSQDKEYGQIATLQAKLAVTKKTLEMSGRNGLEMLKEIDVLKAKLDVAMKALKQCAYSESLMVAKVTKEALAEIGAIK